MQRPQIHSSLTSMVADMVIDDEKRNIDNMMLFYIGLSRIHGLINAREAHQILIKDFPNISYDDFIAFPAKHKRVLFDLTIHQADGIDIIVNRQCHVPFDRLDAYKRTYDYSYEAYRSVGKYAINRTEPTSDTIYKYLEKSLGRYELAVFLRQTWTNSASGIMPDPVGLLKNLIQVIRNPERASQLTNDFMASLPLWFYLGDPRRVINFELPEPVKRVYGKYDPCPCGSGMKHKFCCLNQKRLLANKAILHESESRVLYFLINDLVTFTNHETQMFESTPDDEDFIDSLTQNEYHDIKAHLFTHPDIIDRYMASYAKEFPDEILEMLDGFKKAKTDDFTALKFIDQKLLLLASDEKNAYLVSGIMSHMSELISHEDLPALLHTTIIPFNGHIVYTITFTTYQVTLGPNIRKRLAQNMARINIVTSL